MPLNFSFGGESGEGLVAFTTGSCVPTAEGFFWCGESLNDDEACRHFVVVGSSGSGKTITLKMLMQSVFCKVLNKARAPKTTRAVVYDPKSDLVSFIAGAVQPGVRIRILNPMDARFAPWDIAADVVSEIDAIEFASVLIPKREKESTPYFSDTARSLLAGVILRLIQTMPGKWSLREVLLAFENKASLEEILKHPSTAHLLDHFSSDNAKNYAGVKSTADTALAVYRPVAAAIHNALHDVKRGNGSPQAGPIDKSKFSLSKWVNGKEESILVLGNHENAREATDTLNQLVIRQLSKILIAREGDITNDQTWIFIDELREAGALPGLRQLLLRGRSKGVAVAMGLQDIEGIYAVYGRHEGAEILGAAQNIVVLHINASAPDTAEWASKVLGSVRKQVSSWSYGQVNNAIGARPGEQNHSNSQHFEVVPNVFPIEFMQLKMPSKEHGMFKYFGYSTKRCEHGVGEYPWSWLEANGPIRQFPRMVKDFENHPDDALKNGFFDLSRTQGAKDTRSVQAMDARGGSEPATDKPMEQLENVGIGITRGLKNPMLAD